MSGVQVEGSSGPNAALTVADLYSGYGSWLLGALRKRFGREQAEDLAQDVYARLSQLPLDPAIRHPKAFLMTVASNLAMDARRRARRCRGDAYETVPLGDWDAPESPSQFEHLVLKEAVLSMPQPLRDVFLMSRFRGMTYDAIAAELGISVKTVEWRMSRALVHCVKLTLSCDNPG